MGDTDNMISKDDLPDEVVAYIEKLEDDVDALTASVVAKDDTIDSLQSQVSKGAGPDITTEEGLQVALSKMDPTYRAIVEKQMADAEEAKEIAKFERDARIEQESIAKAQTMPMLSDNPKDLGSLLRAIGENLSAEDAGQVEKILKAANEAIAQSNIFKEFGSGGAQSTVSKSVDAKAAELQKSDPSLTKEQAITKVYEADPSLYSLALKEG